MQLVKAIAVFVLVACVCLRADARERAVQFPAKDGSFAPCKNLPIAYKSKCAGYSCDAVTGAVTEYGCGFSLNDCVGGTQIHIPRDLTKKFPDCCGKLVCLMPNGTIID